MIILDTKQIAAVSGGEFYSPKNLAAATRFVAALGFLAGAFQAGYIAGQWLNTNTSVQRWISDALE